MTTKTLWKSINGSMRSFDAMDDEHIANICIHLIHYSNRYPVNIRYEIELEIKRRNLSDDFIHGAPYPWKDKATGIWHIWDFEKGDVVRVSGKKEKKVYARCIDSSALKGLTDNKLYPVLSESDDKHFFTYVDDRGSCLGSLWRFTHIWERVEKEEYV